MDFKARPQSAHADNLRVAQMEFTMYFCPSNLNRGLTHGFYPDQSRIQHYFAVAGPGVDKWLPFPEGPCEDMHCCMNEGPFFNDSQVRSAQITDGLSHTALVCETRGQSNQEPDDPVFNSRGMGYHNQSYFQFTPNAENWVPWFPNSYHPGGIHLVLGDGSAHFMANEIDLQVLQTFSTIAGDEFQNGS